MRKNAVKNIRFNSKHRVGPFNNKIILAPTSRHRRQRCSNQVLDSPCLQGYQNASPQSPTSTQCRSNQNPPQRWIQYPANITCSNARQAKLYLATAIKGVKDMDPAPSRGTNNLVRHARGSAPKFYLPDHDVV